MTTSQGAGLGHARTKPAWHVLIRPQSERLAAALIEARSRLAAAKASGKDPVRILRGEDLLEQADAAVREAGRWRAHWGEFVAWDCVAQFDRHMLHLVDSEELRIVWESTLAEAQEKCSGHRKAAVDAITKLIGKEGITPALVEGALHQVQVTSQNQYFKLLQLRRQIAYAGAFLLFLILLVLFAASLGMFVAYSPELDSKLRFGILIGLVGGVLSVAFTVVGTDEKLKIPKLRASFEVTLMRPLIGASLALPIMLIVEAGLVAIGGIDKLWVGAVACFLAAFSDRWFLGLVGDIEKRAASKQ